MLTVVTYLWGTKYGAADVAKLAAGLDRHLDEPYRFAIVTDEGIQLNEAAECGAALWSIPAEDRHLTKIKGCFARLRLFDPGWLFGYGVHDNDRVVCIDLDVVITGKLYPLFYRPESFMILQGANAANPCPYNGSVWMLRAGYRPDVWSDFSIVAAAKVPHYEFPDDQAWLAHKLPNAPGWKSGCQSGIYAFQKPGWPKGEALPNDARIVVFPGWREPAKFAHLSWVKENWQ